MRGKDALTNFDVAHYSAILPQLAAVSVPELVLSLRRQSKGTPRGSSQYKGVTRHAKGKWEARIGSSTAKKYTYLGLFEKEEEAAVAFDHEARRSIRRPSGKPCANCTSALGSGRSV